MSKLLDLKGINLLDLAKDEQLEINQVSQKDIAVIGISARFASTDNVEEFWQALCEGRDCIQEFPSTRRKDTDKFLDYMGFPKKSREYDIGGFLKEIDKFDYQLFSLSPKEASLMDPNQRLFLMSAWEAIEDAGYGSHIAGTRTGVFVGYSPDGETEENYRTFIRKVSPDLEDMAVAGNIKSIIASRIAYLLDLKGPSMLVDTACSSSLVAVHMAVQSLRNGEIDMAIAGGVKVSLLPLKGVSKDIGITSSDGKTRTFDDSSDGTGRGEGVAAILLKPLGQALKDGDHIYAVIKGSAFNQDGSSNGITAPNPIQQEDVIVRAWKDAGINPETITYIEAHGTGTKLGDPIEIKGIQRAFRRFTNRNQFCAISSVKSNLGHLDHTAGIAGLIKAILSLKHKQLPPSIHFTKPNRNIQFEQSPVYVNTKLREWETDETLRRCGVSSFGLAGTNCHIVLEEAPTDPIVKGDEEQGPFVLTLSAKNEDSLHRLVHRYNQIMEQELNLADVCYTANTGRWHHTHRLAIIAQNAIELKQKLNLLTDRDFADIQEEGILYGVHHVLKTQKRGSHVQGITESDIEELSNTVNRKLTHLLDTGEWSKEHLIAIGQLYIQGANVDWPLLYKGQKRKKVSLPTYPFNLQRCWLEIDEYQSKVEIAQTQTDHPLLDDLALETIDTEVYVTKFSVNRHWVLSEHRVGEHYVVPGTTYLEMVRFACKKLVENEMFELRNVTFFAPLHVNEGEEKEVQTIIRDQVDYHRFIIASKDEASGSWVKYAEGEIWPLAVDGTARLSLQSILENCTEEVEILEPTQTSSNGVITGPRWRNVEKVYLGQNEYLALLKLPEPFKADLDQFGLHPSLMDNAMNLIIHSVGEGLYLPFAYTKLHVYRTLPGVFYTYIRTKEKSGSHMETFSFDVTLLDLDGNVIAEATDYIIKKVHATSWKTEPLENHFHYELGWVEQKLPQVQPQKNEQGTILVFKDRVGIADKLIHKLKQENHHVVEVEFGPTFEKSNHAYVITGEQTDYERLISEVTNQQIKQIIHVSSVSGNETHSTVDTLQESQRKGLYSLFYLVKALSANKVRQNIDLVLIADYVNEVTKEEIVIHPHSAALFGLGKVVAQEHDNVKCRCIDIDSDTPLEVIVNELYLNEKSYQVAYRNGKRYVEELRKLELDQQSVQDVNIKENGVYLITGGLGGLGLEMAKYLAKKNHVHLVFVNRSSVPKRDQWEVLKTRHEDQWSKRIQAMLEIEAMGSTVTCYQADVSRMEQMQQVMEDVRKRFGKIDGIIHAAGVAGEGFLIRKEEQVFSEVTSPKIEGTWILHHLTKHEHLDFFILFSSITAIQGGMGQGDYTAANAYLDSFAAFRNKQGKRTLTINWAAWKETGMAVDFGVNHDGDFFKAIRTEDALNALDQVLNQDFTRVILAEVNFHSPLFQKVNELPILLADELKREIIKQKGTRKSADSGISVQHGASVVLTGKEDGYYTESEKKLAEIWHEVLGLNEVNVYDDLYSLGGDSIYAVRLVNAIREKFSKDIDISDIFEHSSIADIAAFLDSQGTEESEHSSEKVATVEERNLSFGQERLWFMDYIGQGNPGYNLTRAYTLRGSLDVVAFQKSLTEVVQRHEILRSTFHAVDGKAVQHVAEAYPVRLAASDIRHLPQEQREDEVQRILTGLAERQFDLTQGPLFEMRLVRLGESEYLFAITLHQIIVDSRSVEILMHEVVTLYEAFVNGDGHQLPVLSVQYADYAHWQRQQASSQEQLMQMEYWKRQLGGELPILQLPLDRPRPALRTYRGQIQKFALSPLLLNTLKQISQQQNVSLDTLLLGAFKVLLHRYSGQGDILVGIKDENRKWANSKELIGMFTNTLVIRSDLSGNPHFVDFVQKLGETVTDAYRNSNIDFAELVRELAPERDLSYSPLVQVMFSVNNASNQEWNSPSFTIKPFEIDWTTVDVDLLLNIDHMENELEGSIAYNRDLFNKRTIERLVNHLQKLLEAIAENPERPIESLSLLSDEESTQLLVEWSINKGEYPRNRSIQECFEAQVEENPEAIALVYREESLTYHELNERANQLAHYLRARGVSKDMPVAISMERSLDLIVGILGILKAGGAYVPLDVSYPEERLAFMMEDAQVPWVLTQQHLLDRLPQGKWKTICLDAEWDQISKESTKNPPLWSKPGDLAYIIYTSGSTGKPKGVAIPHRGVVRLVKAADYVKLTSEDVFLQFSTISFDAATFEIWGSLLNGAKLVLFPHQKATLEELGKALQQYKVTTLFLTTGLFHQMVEWRLDDLRGIRQLLAGGDVLSARHARKVLQALPECVLINAYGPTENTTFTSCYAMTKENQVGNTVPIGRPIAGTEVYVLDSNLQPVPVGVAGELYIGGDGLAIGYVNRPELNEERFIPHPFSEEEGARLYKTGDWVRYLPDGNLDFIGRMDNQVKMRGFRIELGEVEAALNKHPAVRDAVVILREDKPEDKRLVAYIIGESETIHSQEELRRFLKEILPEFMIPSAFIWMDQFPLTHNGKVNRSALPEPQLDRADFEQPYIAPRNEVEKTLAQMWTELLGMEQIGVNDDFFEIGGHSLLATQLLSRILKRYQVEISLPLFFEISRLADLAKKVEELLMQGEYVKDLPMVHVPRDEKLILSYAQQRLWFIEQLNPGTSTYNLPMAVTLKGELHIDCLEQSINEIISRHESLRTSFVVQDGTPVQMIAPEIKVKLPIVDVSGLPYEQRKDKVVELASEDAKIPFDLTQSPLARFILYKLDENYHVLYMCMHHIITDGWSEGIVMRELMELYQAFLAGKPSPLPELPYQYVDYASWQRKWLEGPVMSKQIDYWKKQLSGTLPVLELPTDRPRAEMVSDKGSYEIIIIPADLTEKLNELSKQKGATLFMVLLAAFKLLLHRYSGQEDILVGSPIANRTRIETEGIIGFFVNTIVLRANLAGNPTFSEFLRQVREVTLGAYSHQDVPFEKLVEVLQPERVFNQNPIFQVMFAHQNAPQSEFKISEEQEKELVNLEIERGTSMFDLSFDVVGKHGKLVITAEYRTELFDPTTIRRMLKHYQSLLSEIVQHPDKPISEISMLLPEEKHQILYVFNDTERDFPRDKTVHLLFEEQVERVPDRIAVKYEHEKVTYRELNERANQLANYLMKKGVEKEDRIAILLERSPLIMESILAVWKAGAAYIPIDPAYPSNRIIQILEDSQAKLLLTEAQFLDPNVSDAYQGEILVLSEKQQEIREEDTGNLDLEINTDQLAYIIYTSGSTGKPKGAMVEHIGMMNHMQAKINDLQLTENDIIAQNASHCFDISVWQFFASLMLGGQTVIYKNEWAMMPNQLITLVAKDQVTILEVVPSVLSVILDYLNEFDVALPHLRYLMVTGETLKINLVKRWFEIYPDIPIVNAYGPTEASDDITHFIMDGIPDRDNVPIGKPLQNFKIYIVDEYMNLCPIGVKGEIVVAGVGVGRGYFNDPVRTQQAFLEDPFAKTPGIRMYKTGDLGRWLPNGEIEFFGRKDYQVKIRGFRIELGEIENHIIHHPQVKETVVVDYQDESGNKYLCAYVVLHDDKEMPDLKEYLLETLPDYMVPASFIKMDQLPLNPNGKVDRKALPKPEFSEIVSKTYEAAEDELEEKLISVWKEVLGVQQLGTKDSFFDLGGHSLKATALVMKINKELGLDIPLIEVFKRPTVKEIAQYIRKNVAKNMYSSIEPVEKREHYPLSSAQKRMFILNQMKPDNIAYNMPVILRLEGELDLIRLEQALIKLVERHEILRTSFGWLEGEVVQRVEKDVKIKIDYMEADEDEWQAHVTSYIRPFDLSQAPLARMGLIKMNEQTHVLIFDIHHIVVDGISMRLLINELVKLYQGEELEPVRIHYKDFAVWQNRFIGTDLMKQQEQYWLEMFSDHIPVLELPTDYPRPDELSFEGHQISIELDEELTAKLKELAAETQTTMFMVLLAAYYVLLSKYSHQNDMTVGIPIAGRNHPDLQNVVGMFVNTLALRNRIEPDQTFVDFLNQVKQTLLQAYANQDYPFEELVNKLELDREKNRNPLFDTLFNLQTIEEEEEQGDLLKIDPLESEYTVSKFDLSLNIFETKENIVLNLEYSTRLFKQESIEMIGQNYIALLKQLVSKWDSRIVELDIEQDYEIIESAMDEDIDFQF